MATETTNLKLIKDDPTDFYDIETVNDNLDKIDDKIGELETDKADRKDIPTSLPAKGGDADTVNGHKVESDVPADAKFTDTVYTHPGSHPPSILSKGALPAGVTASAGTDYGTSRLRNIKAGTSEPTSLANGELFLFYE